MNVALGKVSPASPVRHFRNDFNGVTLLTHSLSISLSVIHFVNLSLRFQFFFIIFTVCRRSMRTFNQAGRALPRDASALDSATAQQSSLPTPLGPRPAVSQVPDTQTKTSESFSQDTPRLPSPSSTSISLPHTSLPLTNCLCFPSSLFPSLSVCHFRTRSYSSSL